MIIILDVGIGNVCSVLNMLRRAGGSAKISADVSDIASASAFILPGVGSFDNGMEKLTGSDFFETFKDKVLVDKTPILGICLGMQLLFNASEEGESKGLGWLDGKIKKFDFQGNHQLKIPHMGWNVVKPINQRALFLDMPDEARFYFVHSFHVTCEDSNDISAEAHYGYPFVCSVARDNIFGVQFHPEKSHRFGLALFKNFLEYVDC